MKREKPREESVFRSIHERRVVTTRLTKLIIPVCMEGKDFITALTVWRLTKNLARILPIEIYASSVCEASHGVGKFPLGVLI